jgi:hypothetical protein
MKGQFCGINKNIFCQESHCNECAIFLHTCQFCGIFDSQHVKPTGLTFISARCDNSIECAKRQIALSDKQIKKHVEEN